MSSNRADVRTSLHVPCFLAVAMASLAAPSACSSPDGSPTHVIPEITAAAASAASACAWDPGFGVSGCYQGDWWIEYSVKDTTTAALSVEVAGTPSSSVIDLPYGFRLWGGGMKFAGGPDSGPVPAGTLVRLEATQSASAGGRTAQSTWFPYRKATPAVDCGVCTPSCAPETCGSDGCGGSCACPSGAVCMLDLTCCHPNTNPCGPDGCGGSHGDCQCTPSCSGKQCGSDGCGGTCGTCAAGTTCSGGACVCTPSCGGKQCGDDGCGGTCGTCAAGTTCSGGACVCAPSCGGKQCGDDGCGGTCGTCAAGTTCSGGACVCAPSCGGKQCGDDGCGGTCGTCAAGTSCTGGACVAGCVAPWSPSWQQASYSGTWWAQFDVSGGGSLARTVSLVVGGASFALSYDGVRWAGGLNGVASGTSVVLRATDATGATAQTVPFRYLVDMAPPTDPCKGTPSKSTGCTPLSRGMVTFTMDDSQESQSALAAPLLAKYGMKATIYHITQALEDYGLLPSAKALAAAGHEVADHTRSHDFLTMLSVQGVDDELRLSKQYLLSNVGSPVESFASPMGAYDATVIAAAKRYFTSHRTVSPGLNYMGSDVYELNADGVFDDSTPASVCAGLTEAATHRGWRILVFHDFTTRASASSSLEYPLAGFESILKCAQSTPGLDVVTTRQGAAAIACASP